VPGQEQFDDCGDDDLDEFNEINSSGASSTFLDQRWFRWAGVVVAIAIILSLTLPVLAPLFENKPLPQAGSTEPPSFPDFALPTATGGSVRLAERANSYSAVVLVFHRGVECVPCETQLAELQSGYEELLTEGIEVLSIGLDGQFDTQQLAQRMGIHFPMLYDESGTVASIYGIRDQLTNDVATAVLILNSKLQLLTNPVGINANQVLPVEVIINAVRQAYGNAPIGATAS
jgi:peroxiredoxin